MLLFSTYVCKKENKLKILKENYQIIKIQEKVQIKGLILTFLDPSSFSTFTIYRYVLDPDPDLFVSLHTDPDQTFILQIRIRITVYKWLKLTGTVTVSNKKVQMLECFELF